MESKDTRTFEINPEIEMKIWKRFRLISWNSFLTKI